MAWGNVDRSHSKARAQHPAAPLALVHERRSRAFRHARLGVLAHQERLRAANRRLIENDADVAGDAEPPRVREAVAVNQNQVRLGAEFAKRRHEHGSLAEREEARYVRKSELSPSVLPFDFVKI